MNDTFPECAKGKQADQPGDESRESGQLKNYACSAVCIKYLDEMGENPFENERKKDNSAREMEVFTIMSRTSSWQRNELLRKYMSESECNALRKAAKQPHQNVAGRRISLEERIAERIELYRLRASLHRQAAIVDDSSCRLSAHHCMRTNSVLLCASDVRRIVASAALLEEPADGCHRRLTMERLHCALASLRDATQLHDILLSEFDDMAHKIIEAVQSLIFFGVQEEQNETQHKADESVSVRAFDACDALINLVLRGENS